MHTSGSERALAFVAALRSAYLTHGLLEAYEEKLLPFGIAPQW